MTVLQELGVTAVVPCHFPANPQPRRSRVPMSCRRRAPSSAKPAPALIPTRVLLGWAPLLVLPLVTAASQDCCAGSRLPDYSLLWSFQLLCSHPCGVSGPLQKVQWCRDPHRAPATWNRLTELSLLSFLKEKKKGRNNMFAVVFPT